MQNDFLNLKIFRLALHLFVIVVRFIKNTKAHQFNLLLKTIFGE
jgi:hypothetical protein